MYLLNRWRTGLIAGFLALSLLLTERRVESYGDTLQVVLPVVALGCSAVNGSAVEYMGRYAIMWVGVQTAKRTFPDEMITRPNGAKLGFPSGHTASATFGASSLVFSCLTDAPLLKAAVVISAAFTGASRLDVGAHDVWQVLAGAVWAVMIERGFRRPGILRDRLVRLFQRRRTPVGQRTPGE